MGVKASNPGKLPLWAQVLLFLVVVGGIYLLRSWSPPTEKPSEQEVAEQTDPVPVDISTTGPEEESPAEPMPAVVAETPAEKTQPVKPADSAPPSSASETTTDVPTKPVVPPPTKPAVPAKPAPPPRKGIYVEEEVAHNVRIDDIDGNPVYHGDITLTATLNRIERDQTLRYANDGSVFSNRERRLPSKINGYYREWVHPTQGLDGPGPQRIITGKGGEIYYTPDHYGHFYRVQRK